jgi:hypothetical protein
VQLIVLAIFVVLGIFAVKGFRGAPAAAQAAWKNSKAA